MSEFSKEKIDYENLTIEDLDKEIEAVKDCITYLENQVERKSDFDSSNFTKSEVRGFMKDIEDDRRIIRIFKDGINMYEKIKTRIKNECNSRSH